MTVRAPAGRWRLRAGGTTSPAEKARVAKRPCPAPAMRDGPTASPSAASAASQSRGADGGSGEFGRSSRIAGCGRGGGLGGLGGDGSVSCRARPMQ